MKTRSRGGLPMDDVDTETDDSSLGNLIPRQRPIREINRNKHLQSYSRRSLRLLQSHLHSAIKRERDGGRDTDQKSAAEDRHRDDQVVRCPIKVIPYNSIGHENDSSRDTDQKSLVASSSNSNDMYLNGSGSRNNSSSVRRSTRQRKLTYDNLNQRWLVGTSIPPEFAKLESLFHGEQSNTNDENGMRGKNSESRKLGLDGAGLDFEDMYSRVKRKRRKTVHAFYTRRISQDAGSMADTEDTDRNGLSDSDTIDDHSDIERGGPQFSGGIAVGEAQEDSVDHPPKAYSLRPKKPITDRFQCPIKTKRPRRSATIFESTHTQERERESYKTRAHRTHLFRRKRHALHNSSSSSSSSDDERRFEKKKTLSMVRARSRCLPLNFIEGDLANGTLRDRVKIGSSLADIDPMNIDKTVSFDHVGGLDSHIRSLKEMILFPLMYPEVFQRFKISPPRGVLFYGQPGTGKTLVARALANECSTGDKRVAFFMRKGADCLSKWVGESERQLRLLFDQAYSMRPSIIFFDEIDGLAPVRSTRQDQIHSSIVSTLLALMDGLDNRGEIVIIGATNRLDAIDPALRRPGRFDRELLFPLPSFQARNLILKIITKDWTPRLPGDLITELAICSSGYCGADLKALCSEAALIALRRRYPQIYESKQKLQLDVETIQVEPTDFINALKKMKPSVQRCSAVSAKPLSSTVKPLLEQTLHSVVYKISKIFPFFQSKNQFGNANNCDKNASSNVDSEDSDSCLYLDNIPKLNNFCAAPSKDSMNFMEIKSHLTSLSPIVHRPYFLMSGKDGQGQGSLAPAVLHLFENVSVHRLDIPALYAVTTRAPEEACAQIFHEAQRNVPSVIFLPHIGNWWDTLSETVRATFLSLLQDLDPSLPMMLFATSDVTYYQLPMKIQEIFGAYSDQVFSMRNPNLEERKAFFHGLVKEIYKLPRKKTKIVDLEELPVAPPPDVRKLTAIELNKLKQSEEATLRELRLFLRDILNKLAKDRRFYVFSRPVDPIEVPDYAEVIKIPMDLETMMSKIDRHKYETVGQFLSDIDLICQNALEYNSDRDPSGKIIRHRACSLKDMAHAMVLTELDVEFEKLCQDIQVSRKERGETGAKDLPKGLSNCTRKSTNTRNFAAITDNHVNHANAAINDNAVDGPNEIKTNAEDMSPTRYSMRTRKANGTLPSPKRGLRYMIWRKRRKSPWFGGCKQRLIRRRIPFKPKNANVEVAKIPKIVSPQNGAKFVRLSEPIKQECDAETSSTLAASPIEDKKEMSDSSATLISPKSSSAENTIETDLIKENGISFAKRHCDMSKQLNHCSPNFTLRSPPRSALSRSPLKSSPVRIEKTSTSPVTRSRTEALLHSSPPELQLAILSDDISSPRIIIDTATLDCFMNRVARVTENYTVERLLQLYSVLQQCIYSRRRDLDKKILLRELDQNLDSFLRHKPS